MDVDKPLGSESLFKVDWKGDCNIMAVLAHSYLGPNVSVLPRHEDPNIWIPFLQYIYGIG